MAGSHQPSNRESGPLESTCRWKALGAAKVVLLDERAAETVLALRDTRVHWNPVNARGATASVRGSSPALRVAENATPGRRRPIGWRSEPSANRGRRRCAEEPKLEACRQARSQPGSGCRKVVRRREGELDLGRGSAPRSARVRVARAPGNRTVHGCTCRESVAEVGEKHLLHVVEGSREANRDERGVARRGGSSFDEASSSASGEPVRGGLART